MERLKRDSAAQSVLKLNVRSTIPRIMLRIVIVLERRITMTMINEVLINGSLYVCSLGVLGLAWASLQRSER
jgi:hypothetical protein